MTENKNIKCPFQWGDRINHKLFGLGTVDRNPVGVCGPDRQGHQTVSQGWTIPVKWDDENRTAAKVASFALRLVTRLDAKGGAYWNNEYKKLLEVVQDVRANTDANLLAAFRPNEGTARSTLDELLKLENAALEKLRNFLTDDENGNHS